LFAQNSETFLHHLHEGDQSRVIGPSAQDSRENSRNKISQKYSPPQEIMTDQRE